MVRHGMPGSISEPEEFFGSVESYLEGCPTNANNELEGMLSSLTDFVNAGDIETAEKAIKLLGNAAGKEGILSLALPSI